MPDTNSYRRPAFQARPWITSGLWDKYSRKTVLHMDAYLFALAGTGYALLIEYREGGRRLIARDAYLIRPALGLVRVDPMKVIGSGPVAVLWSPGWPWMRRVHAAVVRMAQATLAPRVTLQAHYVPARDVDPWVSGALTRNVFKAPVRLGELNQPEIPSALPDVL